MVYAFHWLLTSISTDFNSLYAISIKELIK